MGSAVHLNNSVWQKTSEKAQVSQLEQINALPGVTSRKLWSYMLIQADIRIDGSIKNIYPHMPEEISFFL